MPELAASLLLDRRLIRLRRRHLLRRGVEVLTLAMAADLSLTLFALGAALFFQLDIPVDTFALLLLLILLAREGLNWKMDKFLLFLDRRFSLADRLGSHLWYVRTPAVPDEVREAQAAECLRSVDFSLLSRKTGPRVPPLLLLVGPLFAALVLLDLNSLPAPPGFLGQTLSRAVRAVAPGQRPSGWTGQEEVGGGKSREEITDLVFTTPGQGPAGTATAPDALATPGQPGPGAGAAQLDLSLPPASGDGSGASGELGGGNIPTGRATESFPVGRAVSPPVPRVLTEEPTFDPSLFAPGGRLLELLPGAARSGAATFDTTSLARLGRDFSRYPVRYRGQMEAYFKELWTWPQK